MFSEWIEEAKEDLKFETDLMKFEKNFGVVQKLSKWLERREKLLKKYSALLKKKKEIERRLFEYYKTEYIISPSTREELKLLMTTDKDYVELDEEIMKIERAIKFVEKVIEGLKMKSYEIKYFLEYKKLMEGY